MIKNKAGWVALIVLASATALMVFFVLPNINGATDVIDAKAPQATEPKPVETAAVDPKSASKSARPAPAGEASSESASLTAPPAAEFAAPAFDLLRVEPDGSTVIAGRAEPGSKLEVLSGQTVIATADVNAAGDFAAVLDRPLDPGDYQLVLRSLGKDGAAKSSAEVATVSIPKDTSGELLAMVSKPGEASRIITAPAGATAAAVAASDPVKPAETASASASGAAVTVDAAVTPMAPASGAQAGVAVSAVEIEGKRIFVAGSAKPGALVRIYADEKLVGEMKADEQGRFVVDGTMELSVGNHTIRADMMTPNGSAVELRAAVPFNRPAGTQVAAVAQADAAGSVASFEGGSFDGLRVEASKAVGLLKGLFADGKVPTVEQLTAARSSTEIALNSLAEYKVANTLDAGVKETVAKTAKAAGEALALLKALPQDPASIASSLPRIEAAVGSALMPRTDGTGETAVAKAPAASETTTADATQPGDAVPGLEPAVGDVDPAASGTGTEQAAATPETVQQAPLQQSKTSVIIRRGDTLWQISRRVYGAGVRYTTIYLANEDQITNPDRIMPGQIFGVPDTAMTDAESEELHRKYRKPVR